LAIIKNIAKDIISLSADGTSVFFEIAITSVYEEIILLDKYKVCVTR
jgi:hypothetical protein